MRAASLLLLLFLGAACGGGSQTESVYVFDDPQLGTMTPATLVPGSRILIEGRSFVPADVGQTWLRLSGTFGGLAVDVSLPAEFVDYSHLEVLFQGGGLAGFPGDSGTFQGTAALEIANSVDGILHASAPLALSLEIAPALSPRLDLVASGPIWVNDPIPVEGDGLLLGGDEGETVAVVSGCYRKEGATSCVPVGPTEVPVVPESMATRSRGAFAFDPHIAGIEPGHLENGTVRLRNRHGSLAGGVTVESDERSATYDIQPAAVFSVTPSVASLGQYVDINGGGFVGLPPGLSDPTIVTTFELVGDFTSEGATEPSAVSLTIVGDFVSGRLVRYVLNDQDELGRAADLRHNAGSFTGTLRPVVVFGSETVYGDPTPVSLSLAHVKQVVWVKFQPSYVESLRHFGLRAVDQQIRDRIMQVAARDYTGINIEFRTEEPTDFAHYSQVELGGADPNHLGLLGYDNTPGKDTDNLRLYDKIGGDNALTREDGYPGYGGVFVESFFGFSEHPGTFSESLDGASTIFDLLFDPFRPDQGGHPVSAYELASGGTGALDSGSACPASQGGRPTQIGCAVWALGSMIGSTMTHEVGHSLGLADPYGRDFHNPGDLPNRLMESGGARPFEERAELKGQGPAVFCDTEFQYLRQILPSTEAAPPAERPPCY